MGVFIKGGKKTAIKILIISFSNLSMLNRYFKEASNKIKILVNWGLGYNNPPLSNYAFIWFKGEFVWGETNKLKHSTQSIFSFTVFIKYPAITEKVAVFIEFGGIASTFSNFSISVAIRY